MSNFIKQLAVAALISVGAGAAMHAQAAAINLTTPGREFSGDAYTLGFEFTVNSNTTIRSLGVYDSGADGLGAGGARVGLWDIAGNLLTSAKVLAGTGSELDGLFRYANISEFNLVTGTNYIIGAYTTDLATSLGNGNFGTGSVDSNINIVKDRYSNFNFAFSFPTNSDNHVGGAWLGANFRTDATTVPEPGTAALVGLAFMGLMLGRHRRAV